MGMFMPEFTPSLLYLLMLLPAAVGKRRQTYNGNPGHDSGESDSKTLVMGCLALAVYFVGNPLAMLYSLYPRYFGFAQLFPQQPATVFVGAMLASAGILLTCWARYVLAGNWVGGPFLRQNHQLVAVGPYRVVRHPMYSGFALFHVGLLVATGNVVPLVCDGLLRASLLSQAWAEERLLTARFGQTYMNYKRNTGRFLPKIRRR